jgi:hypothetical protein
MTSTITHSPVSSFGQLTTIFTPPATCLENYYGGGLSILQAELGNDQFHGLWHTECFPPNHNPDRSIDPIGWYSPGICPSGYSAALVSTTTDTALESEYSSYGFSTSSIADETTVWCCPA